MQTFVQRTNATDLMNKYSVSRAEYLEYGHAYCNDRFDTAVYGRPLD